MTDKRIVFGNLKKEQVVKDKGGVFIIGDCVWCDLPVWLSGLGYDSDDPTKDIQAPKPGDKDLKILHKECLIEIMQIGRQVAETVTKHKQYTEAN